MQASISSLVAEGMERWRIRGELSRGESSAGDRELREELGTGIDLTPILE